MNLAPIAIFCYERVEHLEKLIEHLCGNHLAKESEVYFFLDGPKSDNAKKVDLVFEYVSSLRSFKRTEIIQRDGNLGLSRSIITGVNHVFEEHDRVIVLEDDLLPAPSFLTYCNESLNRYEHCHEVGCIHGYNYPIEKKSSSFFFLRGADSWGWATWKDSWKLFDQDGQFLLKSLKKRRLTRSFDLDGSYHFTKTLRNCILGKNDSWAIRWHASLFLAGKLTLYPPSSLINNIGLDSSGTHCSTTDKYDVKYSIDFQNFNFPEKISENFEMREKIKSFHKPGRKNFKISYMYEILCKTLFRNNGI